jgi:enamine deaminase RidA (YjgF/YER057c/UK114 family)
MSIERKHIGPRLSQAVIHGDTVYLAGIVADHPIPDAAAQTGQILDQIDKLLAECGTDKSKILMATIWLSDVRYYDEMTRCGTSGWQPATLLRAPASRQSSRSPSTSLRFASWPRASQQFPPLLPEDGWPRSGRGGGSLPVARSAGVVGAGPGLPWPKVERQLNAMLCSRP